MAIHRRDSFEKRWQTTIHHERWLVSYSDFITLLFAFFVVMYSVSQVNETKYQELTQTLQNSFNQSATQAKSEAPVEGEQLQVADLNAVQQSLVEQFKNIEGVTATAIEVDLNKEYVEISLDAELLFATAEAALSRKAKSVLGEIAKTLAENGNQVIVAGHTDDQPIASRQYASNWALSSARAVAVVDALAFAGVHPERMSAVGYGEYQPIADNRTEDGRKKNRRVVVQVASHSAPVPETTTVSRANESDANGAFEQNTTTNDGVNATLPTATREARNNSSRPASTETKSIQPVTLEDGSLLFTNDPDLPRLNPVSSPSP